MQQLQDTIELAFDKRASLSPGSADPKSATRSDR